MISARVHEERSRHLRALSPPARPPVPPPSPTIATYDDYRRALAAVQHLREQGHSNAHVALTGFDEVLVRPDSDISQVAQRASLPAAVASAVTLGTAALLDPVTIDGPLLVLVALVLLSSAVTSIVVGLFRGARHGLPVRATRLVPTSYEVRCPAAEGGARPTPAEHQLASWWATGLDGDPLTPDGARVVRG